MSLTVGFWLQEPGKATVQSLGTVLSRLAGQEGQNLTDTWSQQKPKSHCVEKRLGGDGGKQGHREKLGGKRGGPGVGE